MRTRLAILVLVLLSTAAQALVTTGAGADDGINNGPSDSGWGTGCCW